MNTKKNFLIQYFRFVKLITINFIMGLNVNYVFVDKALTKIKDIFGDISKDKQESLTDDVLDFLEKMEKKYKNVKKKT